MTEIFAAKQLTDGNGEPPRVSLIQGIINEVEASNHHKQRAIDLLDDLKAWLIRSLERDVGFNMRLVQAIADNTTPVDSTMLESDIQKIASRFGANGSDGSTPAEKK